MLKASMTNALLEFAIGGLVIIGLALLVGNQDYLGLSLPTAPQPAIVVMGEPNRPRGCLHPARRHHRRVRPDHQGGY